MESAPSLFSGLRISQTPKANMSAKEAKARIKINKLLEEAKSEDKNPLVGKEQARKYAKSQNCRFAILSNGNLHYFWDLNHGNPHIITRFPRPDSVASYTRFQPNPDRLVSESIVAEIEAEQALVAANRELITRFEKKLQTTIGRIWGEDVSAFIEA